MQSKININIAVDVIAALSERKLEKHVFLMDNSLLGGTGQGTNHLTTFCRPGQVIKWLVYAIDLQTPVAIKNITFIGGNNDCNSMDQVNCGYGERDNPDTKDWTGIVPCYMVPQLPYRYRLELQMGEGLHSILCIDAPSLMRV